MLHGNVKTVLSYLLITFVLLYSPTYGLAQVFADFNSSDLSGCSPHVAAFNDISVGGIVYRSWDFGNGNTSIGNNINPSNIYTSPGYYDITLIVSDGIDTATITKSAYIHVLTAPTASFTTQSLTSGCAEFPFSVMDASTFVTSPIVNWEWDFDDGTPIISGQNLTHSFTNPGNFGVTLTVTDNIGCSNTITIPNLVTVIEKPTANFYTTGQLSACSPPLNVFIQNSSTGTPPLLYNWTLAGTSYTTPNVNTQLQTSGGYDVELIVTNGLGCTDTLSIPNYIYIGMVQAAMIIPDTVCPNESVEMFDNSLGGNIFYWDYGDGSSGVGDVVYHTYATAGTYTVTLVASAGVGCMDTITQNIVVEYVQAAFSSTPHFACETPLVVNFTDLSVGNIESWLWNFGSVIGVCPNCQSDTSLQQNPTNIYYSEGNYDDTLTVTTYNGCQSTVIVPNNEQIEIVHPSCIPDKIDGCGPLTVNFLNTTIPTALISNVYWDFGDGSPVSNTFSPSHTFVNYGTYNVQLTVLSTTGCYTDTVIEIKVGSHQIPNFAIDTLVACGSDTVGFVNFSSDTNIIDDYIWDFGDGTGSLGFEPEHSFLDTGYLSVMLVVNSNGCKDTLVIDSVINILGPIVNFGPDIDCDFPNQVNFFSGTKGGTNIYWDFGDSTAIDSVNWNTSHNYPASDGNYIVTLLVTDSITGCEQTKSNAVHVRFLVGNIMASDTSICKDELVSFTTAFSTNALGNVLWSINSTTSFNTGLALIDTVFHQTGIWTVYAILNDENGCQDTVNQDIYAFEPSANFSATPTSGCSPLAVQFTDNSFSDTNIVSWSWDFGNGASSTIQNPNFVYSTFSNSYFDIVLTVTDTFGCENWVEIPQMIFVRNPPSTFLAINPLICDLDSVVFYNAPIGNYTYLWDFGDGTTSSLISPKHGYSAGAYTVSLTVTDVDGCDSTFIRPNYVKVQDYPIADFVANPTTTNCYPTSVIFQDSSIAQNVATWTWNFGDSPTSAVLTVPFAQNLYTQPGIYDVSLVVTTTYGCSDTIMKPQFIDVGGPTANIVGYPTIGCVNQQIEFDVNQTNSNVNIFVWGFGDGEVDTVYAPNTTLNHSYSNPGFYTVVLLYSDSMGLCDKLDTVKIEVDEVVADFILEDSVGCNPFEFKFESTSIGADKWNWKIGNQMISTIPKDSIAISISGIHKIQLIAWNTHSQCTDSIIKSIEVFPLPDIQSIPDQVVCIGDSLRLEAAGGDFYAWSPTTYLADSTIQNPISIPKQSIRYYVVGRDSNGCVNIDSIDVYVQFRPVLEYFPMDTTMFQGDEFQIQTLANMNLLYQWVPSDFLDCSNCSNPIATPYTTTEYTLIYSDVNNCFQFDSAFTINVSDEFKVYLPNSFTPNWDGDNDVFKPVIYGVEEVLFFRIFDRWGKMVFETTSLHQGWDGRVDGEIAAHNSIFSYSLRVRRFNNEEKVFTGMIVLISP